MQGSPQTRDVQLGSVLLEDVIAGPFELAPGRAEEVERLIAGLSGPEVSKSLKGYEKAPLKALCAERAGHMYPELDVGFLNMSTTLTYRGHEIQVPKFGVYKYFGDTNSFGMALVNRDENPNSVMHRNPTLDVTIYPELHRALNSPLLESLGIPGEPRSLGKRNIQNRPKGNEFRYSLSREEGKERRRELDDFRVETVFNGLVPEKTQEEVMRSARKVFTEKELYIVSEVSPEEWAIDEIPRPVFIADPLVIGVANSEGIGDEKVFLVDHFDTTHLEEHVRREWTTSSPD